MNLRQRAEADLAFMIEDAIFGFGWPVVVTTPAGVSFSLVGMSNDIAQLIDPDTGQAVSGRLATVVLRLSSVDAAGHGRPVGVSDASAKPWLVTFDDIGGQSFTFKVVESDPDRALGVLLCMLGAYA